MAIKYRSEQWHRRHMLLEAMMALGEDRSVPYEVASAAAEALCAVLSASRSDRLKDIVDLPAPPKPLKNRDQLVEFSRRYRELRHTELEHHEILQEVAILMGADDSTVRGWWRKGGVQFDIYLEERSRKRRRRRPPG